MESRLRSLVTAVALATLVAIAVVVNATVAVANLRRISESQAAVTRTHQVLEALDRVLSSVQDAETGQRGYLITGDRRYLEPYWAGLASIDAALDELATLARDGPEQQQHVAMLRPAIRAKIDELKETIEVRQSGADGFEAARRVVLEDRGKNLMDAVRRQVSSMARSQEALLADRTRRSTEATRVARNTALLGLLASLLLLAACVEVFRRRVRERDAAAAVLERERDRFRTTLTSIGDAVIVTDAEGRITMMNPTAQEVLRWDDAAVGRELREVFRIVDEETREPLESPVTKVLATGQVVGLANHSVALRRDDTEVAIDDSGAPITDEHGTIIGVVLVFRDITRRRAVERELQQKNELLSEHDRRKNEFLAILSHELRNPLAPIRNAVVILNRTDPASAQARRARAIIDRQVSQLAHLVDDLLDLSRISEGKLRLAREPVSLSEVLRRTVEDHLSLFQPQGVVLRLDAPEDVWVEGDASRLVQVVGNLLQNAAKFTAAGGHVDVTLNAEPSTALLRVCDDGAGMDQEMLARLFQPFVQSDRTLARTKGGLGLGLALARTFVELHGGSISATSAGLGRGTEFVVRLPRVAGGAPPQRVARQLGGS